MGALRRILAAILALISLALAVHFVAGELYGIYLSGSHLVWDYLNMLIGLGVVVTLAHHFRRKRAFDRRYQGDNVTVGYLSTNLLLFVSIFLTLWFFANWFEELNINENTSQTVVGFIWIAFNACFVLLGTLTAWQLWNEPYEDAATLDSVGPHPDSGLNAQSDLAFAGQTGSTAAMESAERDASMERADVERGTSASHDR